MERAILDSCVLWPSAQRDFLLQLAAEGGFEAAWSKEILNEVRRNERKKLARPGGVAPGVAMARADKLIRNMRGAFPRAEVTGYEYREGRYRLPDPKDEHVVAAATVAGSRPSSRRTGRTSRPAGYLKDLEYLQKSRSSAPGPSPGAWSARTLPRP